MYCFYNINIIFKKYGSGGNKIYCSLVWQQYCLIKSIKGGSDHIYEKGNVPLFFKRMGRILKSKIFSYLIISF